MKILTFATRLMMKSYRGWKTHRWVQEELLKKVQDRGSWYPVTLDGYIEIYLSLHYRMFQYIEYERQRENDASL